jgi:curli biogenesis system outer membrane secretion channel CsgG
MFNSEESLVNFLKADYKLELIPDTTDLFEVVKREIEMDIEEGKKIKIALTNIGYQGSGASGVLESLLTQADLFDVSKRENYCSAENMKHILSKIQEDEKIKVNKPWYSIF